MSKLLGLISPKALQPKETTLSMIVSPIAKGVKKEIIERPALSILSFAAFGEAIAVVPGPEGGPDISNQQTGFMPGCRFCKDVIASGNYQHPIHGWSLDVDGKRMDSWVKSFEAMTKDGIKVPIYADHKPSTITHLGYLSGLCRGGPEALKKYPELAKLPADKAPLNPKRLYAIHEFKDEASAALAKGVGQVSVLIDKDMKGGNGKKYGEAIRHVAVTPEPVVAGQDGFMRLALSDDKTQSAIPVFVVSNREASA
jgi:hypothetical protein